MVPQTYQRAQSVGVQDPTTPSPAALYSVPQIMQNNYLKGRPVVSIDEARASQIDLDGSLYVFPDLGNKKIYTKQINLDGTAAFNIFELVPVNGEPVTSEVKPAYVTRDELDQILAEFKTSLGSAKVSKPTSAPQNFNL